MNPDDITSGTYTGAKITIDGKPIDSPTALDATRTWTATISLKTIDPIDAAVTAILCIVGCHTMGRVQVSSDGDADEWAVGLALAQSVQPGATLPNRIDEGVCDE